MHLSFYCHTSYGAKFHFIFIFNFLGMVAPQLKRNCFTGGHAFKYSKNLINNLQLMIAIKTKKSR